MNYQKIYDEIIEKRLASNIEEGVYYEKHHILPKCLGGTNKKSNLVSLTAKEHYICHLLLVKMAKNTNEKIRMIYALNAMRWSQVEKRGLSSNQYNKIKKKYAQSRSENMKGNNNHFFGKTHSDETKEKIRKSSSRPQIVIFGEEKTKEMNKSRSETLMGRTRNINGQNSLE